MMKKMSKNFKKVGLISTFIFSLLLLGWSIDLINFDSLMDQGNFGYIISFIIWVISLLSIYYLFFLIVEKIMYAGVLVKNKIWERFSYLILDKVKTTSNFKNFANSVNGFEIKIETVEEKELKRAKREKYSSSELSTKWTIVPFLLFFTSIIYIVGVLLFSGTKFIFDFNSIFALTIGSFSLIGIAHSSLEEGWMKVLQVKNGLHTKHPEFKFSNYNNIYDDSKAYFDSFSLYLFYVFTKIVSYLLTIFCLTAILLVLYLFFFSNLPSKSSDPLSTSSTIIIILLVMIYFEVVK